jgi:hypothetical protein
VLTCPRQARPPAAKQRPTSTSQKSRTFYSFVFGRNKSRSNGVGLFLTKNKPKPLERDLFRPNTKEYLNKTYVLSKKKLIVFVFSAFPRTFFWGKLFLGGFFSPQKKVLGKAENQKQAF